MRRAERQAAEELAALLDGARVPGDVDPVLAELARLAEDVRTVTATLPAPDPAFAASLRAELLTAPAAAPTLVERALELVERATSGWRHSLQVATASGMSAVVVATAGVGVASQQANPGDLLYGVKLATEDLRLVLGRTDEADGRLQLAFAEERLEELLAINADVPADLDLTLDALGLMDELSIDGVTALLRSFVERADDRIPALITDFTARQGEGLDELSDQVDPAAAAAVADSRELLRRIEVQVAEVTDPCGDCGTDPVAASPSDASLGPVVEPVVTAPGEGPVIDVTAPCRCDDGSGVVPIGEPAGEPAVGEEPGPPAVDESPGPVPPPADDPPVQDPPAEEPPRLDLPGPLDDVEDVVDGILDPVDDAQDLDEAVDDGVGDVVDQVQEGDEPLPDPVEQPVDDGAGTAGDLVDDLLGS